MMATTPPFDNPNELLPLVDEAGQVVGKALRGECHDGTKKLHPVVHVHVFNRAGELYLQHRPSWKKIQPNRWDTAVGGHIGYGESLEEALQRETLEEIGLTDFRAQLIHQYVFESDCEREYVYVYCVLTNEMPRPSEELDGGRFFTADEIRQGIGQGLFTPMFESEWLTLTQLDLFPHFPA